MSTLPPLRPARPEPDPAATPDDAGSVTWAPGPWDGGPGARDPACPAGRPRRPGLAPRRFDDDPPTDPHGFPPIPAASLAASAGGGARRGIRPSRRRIRGRPRPWPAPSPPTTCRGTRTTPGGAGGRWPTTWRRRPATRPCSAGTGGAGSGRSSPCPVPVRPDGDDRVLVDVRVRVTPYRAVGDAHGRTSPGPSRTCPACRPPRPAPTGRGWHGCASYWVRLIVPVVRDDGRLVVDAARGDRRPDRESRGRPGGRTPTIRGPTGTGDAVPDADGAGVPERLPSPVERAARIHTPEPEGAW